MSNLRRTLKCPICMEKFANTANTTVPNNKDGTVPVAKACGHVFHRACINRTVTAARRVSRAVQKTCPVCRFANRSYNISMNWGTQMAYVNAERIRRLQPPTTATTAPGVPVPTATPTQ